MHCHMPGGSLVLIQIIHQLIKDNILEIVIISLESIDSRGEGFHFLKKQSQGFLTFLFYLVD